MATGDDENITTLFGRLIDNGDRFVRAELRLYRAGLFERLAGARAAIVMLVLAFLLGQAAIIALLVGLIASLLRPLGAIAATAIVVGGAVVVAGLLVRLAIGKLRKATEIEDRK